MDMTTVHTADSTVEAEVAAGLLRSLGFEVITVVKDPYTESPTDGSEGVVDLTVPAGQAADARRALADAATAAAADPADGAHGEPGVVPPPP